MVTGLVMTGQEMMAHVLEIGEEKKIRLIIDTGMHPMDAKANKYECAVHIPYVKDKRSYAISLHEIGHVVPCLDEEAKKKLKAENNDDDDDDETPFSFKKVTRNIHALVDEEKSAWTWARTNARYWDEDMDKLEALAFKTYTAHVAVLTEMKDLLTTIEKMFKNKNIDIKVGGVIGGEPFVKELK